MAVTLVVLSGGEPSLPPLSLTLDAPRLVLGRGEGCDVRLPDPSVSHRHASIRQRGGEHVLLDENSTNGTFMDQVRLPPQTPRVLRSGERVRLGRVWIEVRFEPAVVKGSTAAAAKELALALVSRGLAAQGLADTYPAAEALAELERGPDERLPDGAEVSPPPAPASPGEETPAPPPNEAAGELTPTPAPAEAGARARAKGDGSGWGMADSLVVVLALGVLALSAVGAVLLLGR